MFLVSFTAIVVQLDNEGEPETTSVYESLLLWMLAAIGLATVAALSGADAGEKQSLLAAAAALNVHYKENGATKELHKLSKLSWNVSECADRLYCCQINCFYVNLCSCCSRHNERERLLARRQELHAVKRARAEFKIKAALSPQQIEEAKEAFDLFDTDGSKSIDVEELKPALSFIGCNPTASELFKMMRDADKDCNGQLELNEFLSLVASLTGWKEKYSSKDKRSYWANPTTREKSWTKPAHVVAAEKAAAKKEDNFYALDDNAHGCECIMLGCKCKKKPAHVQGETLNPLSMDKYSRTETFETE